MQSQLQILFIDDHAGILEGISSSLMQKDGRLRFCLAENTAGAVRLLRKKAEIALAIVDLSLGGEDGLETVSALKTIRPGLSVIVLLDVRRFVPHKSRA